MKRVFISFSLVLLSIAANAQTLLYQWAFNNSADTTNASAATYAVTPGTGNLVAKDLLGDVVATIGTDGINPKIYFTTNTAAGPGSTNGAYVLNGQDYGNGAVNAGIAMATNLNIGDSAQFTLTYWIRFDGAYPLANGQLPRLVMVGASQTYDNGGNNGVGSSINANSGNQEFQNGIGGSSTVANNTVTVTNAFPTSGPYSGNNGGQAGLPEGTGANNSGTWLFVAETYDSLKTGTNFITWIGTAGQGVTNWDAPYTIVAGIIHFSTNASIFLGNRNTSGTRGIAIGALSDVRFYNGICAVADLNRIRQFQTPLLTNSAPSAPVIGVQPVSGKTFVGGSRTFSVAASGVPATDMLTYLWRSNNIAVIGGTNASLTVSNVQLAASGATFVCSVTNSSGGLNTAAATLTVISPVSGSYAEAVYTNHPYSFWMINESSNNIVTIYDYANGQDGSAPNPSGNLFLDGPSASSYPGFPSTNTSIETITSRNSKLNLASSGSFPNTGMTICGWMRTPTGTGSHGIIYDQLADFGSAFGIKYSGGAISYQWGGAPASGFTMGVAPNVNDWTFVALVISTNLTAADIASSITADTNVTMYVGSHLLGFTSATDSTALNGSIMANGTSASVIALGRTTDSSSENGLYYEIDTSDFNAVSVFYSALSAQTITNLYLKGAGLYLNGVPDVNTAGNMLLTYPLGTLQESTNVQGTYHDVSGSPTSPQSVPMTDPQHFYRVRQ